ncbi:Hypothetical predicted protein [Paramuricea clavata]|uniref:Uncharacterized protein n=1 Tax=Paramuricea clavata TaxID=317549 RepID=A0A6S7H6P2_PARCT|nr:Hypothetical predicted protein [Paramuricea clavata]
MSDNAKRIVCGIEGRKTMLLSQNRGTDQRNIYFSALENLPEVNRSIIHQPEPSQQVSASSSSGEVGVSVIEDTVSGEEAVDVDNDGEPGEETYLDEYTAEGLIEEVRRSRPCLWNTSLRVYKEANRKKIAWEQIAQKFSKDAQALSSGFKEFQIVAILNLKDRCPVAVLCKGVSIMLEFLVTRDEMSPRLTNCSVSFPSVWKNAEVVPIHKSGDHEIANNNRHISLLPVLSKICERAAYNQFSTYLLLNDRLSSKQSGNKHLHSTETSVIQTTDMILNAIDKKQLTAIVLLDMSKAFDSIDTTTLITKLEDVGASCQAIQWFQSYLTSRYQVVRIQTTLSDPLEVFYLNNTFEARNDVKNQGAGQIRVCNEKNNMAPKFDKIANFDKQFLLYY